MWSHSIPWVAAFQGRFAGVVLAEINAAIPRWSNQRLATASSFCRGFVIEGKARGHGGTGRGSLGGWRSAPKVNRAGSVR
jgi:hypothetical protein